MEGTTEAEGQGAHMGPMDPRSGRKPGCMPTVLPRGKLFRFSLRQAAKQARQAQRTGDLGFPRTGEAEPRTHSCLCLDCWVFLPFWMNSSSSGLPVGQRKRGLVARSPDRRLRVPPCPLTLLEERVLEFEWRRHNLDKPERLRQVGSKETASNQGVEDGQQPEELTVIWRMNELIWEMPSTGSTLRWVGHREF